MKNKPTTITLAVLALVFVFMLAPFALAQATSQPTEQLVRIQSEVATGDVIAFFEKSVVIEGVTYAQPWQSVSWNNSDKTVTVNGVTMTYAEVMQFVVAIANQEWAERKAAEAAQQPTARILPPKLTLAATAD